MLVPAGDIVTTVAVGTSEVMTEEVETAGSEFVNQRMSTRLHCGESCKHARVTRHNFVEGNENSCDVSREKIQISIKTTRFKMENTKFSRNFPTSYLENEIARILQIFCSCSSGD
jgi:hypothetical protein